MRRDHRHNIPASASKHGATMRAAMRIACQFGDSVPRRDTLAADYGMSRATSYRFVADYRAVLSEPRRPVDAVEWLAFGDRRSCMRVARALIQHFGARAPTPAELQEPPFAMSRATAFRVWRQYVDCVVYPEAARQGRAA